MIVIGLMSGTSADGTDVAIVEMTGSPPALKWRLSHFLTVPHPPQLRVAILEACDISTGTVDKICKLNVDLAEQFATAVFLAIEGAGLTSADIHLIGSHGQTIWHAPEHPATLQIGEASIIAERTETAVVSNFRARDMAVGGQGAPLIAYVDALLLTHPNKTRAVQNIGGIGNVTFLPPADCKDFVPFAFDTGPGNVLIDHAVAIATDGNETYDQEGSFAAQGQMDSDLLNWLLAQPYFEKQPPKTTGRELFTAVYAQQVWERGVGMGLTAVDIIATLTAFTAHTISQAYKTFLPLLVDEVILSGGGVHNHTLMNMLTELIQPATMMTSDEVGIPSDAKEALAFAILAYESWNGRPGNLPDATGASRPVILGQITY